MRKNPHGSALLTSVIVILVVTVIGVGIIRFAYREVAGAGAGAHEQELVACADAARQLLQSQFRALGMQPTLIEPLNLPLDSADPSDARYRAVGGHYDGVNVSADQVAMLPSASLPTLNDMRDLTNIVTSVGQGGKPTKVMVHCQVGGDPDDPTSGRQLEIEFGLRFGL